MIILALFLAIVLGITIYMSIPKKNYDPYTPKRYSREEVIELFENNTPSSSGRNCSNEQTYVRR